MDNVAKRNVKNWNIFVGDPEYKTNYFLIFRSGFTSERYEIEQFARMRFQKRGLFACLICIWTTCFFLFSQFPLYALLTGNCVIAGCYCFSRGHRGIFCPRSVISIVEIALFCFSGESLMLLIIITHIINTCANLLYLLFWYRHLILSLVHLGLRALYMFYFAREGSLKYVLIDLGIIATSSIFFGYIEKLMKENWVLYDSFKKAQNLMTKLADSSPAPTFLVDTSGNILFTNQSGGKIILQRPSNQRRSILNYVDPESKQILADAIKLAVKESSQEIIAKIFKEEIMEKQNLMISQLELKNTTQYETYKLFLNRFAWKGQNCILITCENNMYMMLANEMILMNEYSMREKIETLQHKVEDAIKSSSTNKESLSKMLFDIMQVRFRNEHSIVASKSFIHKSEESEEFFNLLYLRGRNTLFYRFAGWSSRLNILCGSITTVDYFQCLKVFDIINNKK